jgi:S1-C subfamily serine protease
MKGKNARYPAVGVIAALCVTFVGMASAQDAVPTEILQRTLMIRTSTEQGTGFLIDHGGKLYMVTARHVVAGLPSENATLQARHDGQWLDLHASKILYPASAKVDIAVLVTDEVATKPYSIGCVSKGSGGPTMGQQVWFLGFPFFEGLSSHLRRSDAPSVEFPFIKRATMSAIDGSDPDATVLYFDGFNNRGFSGGPILYWDFTDHVYRILGVVQGYRNDTAQVPINGQPVDTNILVNSGILVAYSIDDAIKAIDKDQEKTK